MTTTVIDGNRVPIPDDIATRLNIRPGTQLDWEASAGAAGTILVRVVTDRAALAKSLHGAGKKFLKEGQDPVRELIEARDREGRERESTL